MLLIKISQIEVNICMVCVAKHNLEATVDTHTNYIFFFKVVSMENVIYFHNNKKK